MKNREKEFSDMAQIDLHLHLDGSLSPETVRKLAAVRGMTLPAGEDELLKYLQVEEDCRDLNQYLQKFALVGELLQTRETIRMAVRELERELQAQGLLYAEIRFAPQKHTAEGLTQEQVVEAAIEGMGQGQLCSQLILCCMRGGDNEKENLETVRVAHKYLGRGVCALDLAGAEALYPTEHFAELFRLARELGVPYTIHAGEAAGPESVYAALEMGASRIGHGVRSVEDPALVELLARRRIPLELCPTSNLNTRVFESLQDYPLKKLLAAGVPVTINTDNMTVSGTTLAGELQKVAEALELTREELCRLRENAIEASWADENHKRRIRRGRALKITYIGHSGFLVETDVCYYLFDYYKGNLPALAVNKPIFVFASHGHADHYNPEIFGILQNLGMQQITAVLSKDIPAGKYPQGIPVVKVTFHQTYELPCQTMVRTLHSTDAGVAFLVSCPQGTLYHGGDLHDWVWEGEPEQDNRQMTGSYRHEIDLLAGMLEGQTLDIAFLPLDPRQEKEYAHGILYFLKKIKVRTVYPMHYWDQPEIIGKFLGEYPEYKSIVRDTERSAQK